MEQGPPVECEVFAVWTIFNKSNSFSALLSLRRQLKGDASQISALPKLPALLSSLILFVFATGEGRSKLILFGMLYVLIITVSFRRVKWF